MAKYRVLYATDLHKRMKDITTIRGYVKVCSEIETDLINLCKQLNVTHFMSGGDWFDKGYGSDVAAALAHTDSDIELAKAVNGNFYGVIGNHIKLHLDSNPELFLIQPHPTLLSRHKVERKEQIMKTPKSLILNGVQFHFMHWNPMAESAMDYKAMIDPNCHYHIGLYHDELIIPSERMYDVNMQDRVSDNTQISNALAGINLAIVGHIHKPLGSFVINKNDGSTTMMIVPGSLTNTDAGEKSRHSEVNLPLIDIDDGGKVTLQFVKFGLRIDELQFMKKIIDEDTRVKLKSLRGNTKETLYEEIEQNTFIGETAEFLTLNKFMTQQGYTQGDKKLIKSVMNNPTDIHTLLSIYKEDTQCKL